MWKFGEILPPHAHIPVSPALIEKLHDGPGTTDSMAKPLYEKHGFSVFTVHRDIPREHVTVILKNICGPSRYIIRKA